MESIGRSGIQYLHPKVHLFFPYALDQGSSFPYTTRGSPPHACKNMEESCCTCATLLKNILLQYDEKSEKPKALDRRLDCCGRVICGNCIAANRRFATYCTKPFIPKHPHTDKIQARSVKSLQLQLLYLKASETQLLILRHLPRNPHLDQKIRQHTLMSFLPTLPSRTHRPRHQRKD